MFFDPEQKEINMSNYASAPADVSIVRLRGRMAGESEIISKEATSAPRHDTATQSEFAYLQYIMTMTLVKRGDNTR